MLIRGPWKPKPYDPADDGYTPDAPMPVWVIVVLVAVFGLVQWLMG